MLQDPTLSLGARPSGQQWCRTTASSSPGSRVAHGRGEVSLAQLGVLTWGIDQGHMVPDAQPRLLRQSGGHSLSLSVQLDTGRCACDRALGK